MSLEPPITIRVVRKTVQRADGLVRSLKGKRRRIDAALFHCFAFKADELPFAQRLLARHARIWLFRCNQRAFAGDFIAIDMSSRRVPKRRAWCLDLKLGAPVKVGGGGAGNSFIQVQAAVAEIARERGVLMPDHELVRVTGDGRALVDLFAAKSTLRLGAAYD